jgi:hypothetical protein
MATTKKHDDPVFGGPPAEGPTPTIDVAAGPDEAPTEANLTGDGPEEASGEPVKFTSPWGSSITVSAEIADAFTDAGYKVQK